MLLHAFWAYAATSHVLWFPWQILLDCLRRVLSKLFLVWSRSVIIWPCCLLMKNCTSLPDLFWQPVKLLMVKGESTCLVPMFVLRSLVNNVVYTISLGVKFWEFWSEIRNEFNDYESKHFTSTNQFFNSIPSILTITSVFWRVYVYATSHHMN